MLRIKTVVSERSVSNAEAGKMIAKFVAKEEAKTTKELDVATSHDGASIGRSDRIADDVVQKLAMVASSLVADQ